MGTRRWRLAAAASILSAFLPGAAAALCGGGFASEDLAVACLARRFETSTDAATRDAAARLLVPLLIAQGRSAELGGGPGPGWVRTSRRIEPVLRYDANANGGNPEGPFRLGGLDFVLPASRTRRPDVVIGGRVTAAARRLLGPGLWTDLRVDGALAYAPSLHVSLRDAQVGGCLRGPVGAAGSLRACGSVVYLGRKLQEERAAVTSVEYARSLFAGGRPVLVTGGVQRRFGDDHVETGLTYGAETILGDRFVLGVSGLLNRPEPGENVERRGLGVTLGGRIGPVAGRVYARGAESWGSNVFGLDRRDRFASVGLSAALPRGLVLDLQHRRRRSTIGFFDETITEVGIRFAGRRF